MPSKLMPLTPSEIRAMKLAQRVKAFSRKRDQDKEIYVVTHYCFICEQSEVCQEERCNFIDLLSAHGDCYGKLSTRAKAEHDVRVADISARDKKIRQKEKRKLYTKEYNRQWNEINADYQKEYRDENYEKWKKWHDKYINSPKGKRTTKAYIENHKDEKAEYMARYNAERKK